MSGSRRDLWTSWKCWASGPRKMDGLGGMLLECVDEGLVKTLCWGHGGSEILLPLGTRKFPATLADRPNRPCKA